MSGGTTIETNERATQMAPSRHLRGLRRLKFFATACGVLFAFAIIQTATLRAAWAAIAHMIAVDPKAPSAAVAEPVKSYERLAASLAALPAQQQAELLMQASIDNDAEAIAAIPQFSDRWTGVLALTPELSGALQTALNSNDLRVRATALDVYLAVYKVPKTQDGAARLAEMIRRRPEGRPWALWMLGALGNRGIEPDRALATLLAHIHDSDEQTRYWAVEGLSHLATAGTIAPLLDAFRNDPSTEVRQRAAAAIAHSGMLMNAQRLAAVPSLIEMAEDPSLDATTKSWVFEALGDITGERLGHDATRWRTWWLDHQPR